MNKEILYDLDDYTIIPEVLTSISSRQQVDPFHYLNHSKTYPLFTAPMDSVVDDNNVRTFLTHNISTIVPRTVRGNKYKNFVNDTLSNVYGDEERLWCAYSLTEFENIFLTIPKGINYQYCVKNKIPFSFNALIDVANGHMQRVIDLCKSAKDNYPSIKIMAGNIANPSTYEQYILSNSIDYARISIGSGNGCLTSQQTGVNYPMGSLIENCKKIKNKYEGSEYLLTKIIADGGVKQYSDINKSLALGADYVMMGSMFTQTLESASDPLYMGFKVSDKVASFFLKKGFKIKKKYRGMSTKAVQKLISDSKKLKVSEGTSRIYTIEKTLDDMMEEIDSYLRSAMSYTNSKTLEEFIGTDNIKVISSNSLKRFKK